MVETPPWPLELTLNTEKTILTVRFDDGSCFTLAAELLRVESPSAEVQGHGTEQKTTPQGKRFVTITEIHPVGSYAVRLVFSDGHDTGLYTWPMLYRYGQEADRLMEDYLTRLTAGGLSRSDEGGD